MALLPEKHFKHAEITAADHQAGGHKCHAGSATGAKRSLSAFITDLEYILYYAFSAFPIRPFTYERVFHHPS